MALQRQVEQELAALSRAADNRRSKFKADPAIAAVKSALIALEAAGSCESREVLEQKLALLEAADEDRRAMLDAPVASFRRAIAQMSNWAEAWRAGDIVAKNDVLRAASVRVELAIDDGAVRRGRVFHVDVVVSDSQT